MAALDLAEPALEPFLIRLALVLSVIVDGAEIGSEDVSSLWTEDSIGEEAGQGVKQRIFAYADAAGVLAEVAASRLFLRGQHR